MFIADAHCDTLYSIAIEHNAPSACAVTPETLCAGGVNLQTFALFAGPEGPAGAPYINACAMIGAAGRTGISMITERLPENPPEKTFGIFSCEGGEIFEGSMNRFMELHSRVRLRMVALTWNNENEIGFSANSGSKNGLKPFGLELINKMDSLGVISDVSHLNEAGFWDVCEKAEIPPMASHSDCRWLCDVPRNLTKHQVKALIDRNGFIGVNFYSEFLRSGGNASLDDVVRHIDTLCEMGAENIIGFGSDFDGIDAWPPELASPTGFPMLLDALKRRGYSQAQLENIAGLNLWRALKNAEGIAVKHGSPV